MSNYSIYPMAIDGYAQIPLAVDKKSPINAESVNRLRSGIINIEKAIGIAPEFSSEFGSFPDFTSRVDNIENLFIGMEALSLTGLYERDNIIHISGEPLHLNGDTTISGATTFGDSITLQEGSLSLPIRQWSSGPGGGGATYLLSDSDFTVLIDNSAALVATTIILPPPAAAVGRIYNIKRIDSGIMDVELSSQGGAAIDGALLALLPNQWDAISVQSYGLGWVIISSQN